MATTSILAGRVFKHPLPALQLPLPPGTPTLKRLFLAQGELAQFYDTDEGVRYLAFIELRAGSVRGNHYHKVKAEGVYVIRGEVELVAEDLASRERASLRLDAGDVAFIPTGIAHALRVISSGDAIEYSPARFDAADIYSYPLT